VHLHVLLVSKCVAAQNVVILGAIGSGKTSPRLRRFSKNLSQEQRATLMRAQDILREEFSDTADAAVLLVAERFVERGTDDKKSASYCIAGLF